MKVILLKAVPKVGKKDDIVEVASGYAQHALFPKKLAIAATQKAIVGLQQHQQNTSASIAIRHNLLDKAINTVNAQTLTMRVKANAQSNLFSKISASDIATYLMQAHRIAIDPATFVLPQGGIKKTGSYPIAVVDGEYTATFTLEVAQL